MKKTVSLAVALAVALSVMAQQSYDRREAYIEKYAPLAIDEMERSGVPASIKLAQAVLESADGTSSLARKSNNHFGIKCHDWTGKTVNHDDDRNNECFRSYSTIEDSYRDHSDFLSTRTRYAFLFEIDPMDYKAWARGLKQAGYATSPEYANALIKIIEEYGLHKYDLIAFNYDGDYKARRSQIEDYDKRKVYENNRVKYILTRKGDTFESLTEELGKMDWELPKFNEMAFSDSLGEGRVIYIQPKRNKAAVKNKTHVVKKGETMYSISQLYAVKMERLYYFNMIMEGMEPLPGTTLQLRKAIKVQQQAPRPEPVKVEPEQEEPELIFEIDP